MKPKIIFMGTPLFAVPVLEALIKHFDVALVITQPDKPFGRKQILTPSPIKELALSNNIKVLTPTKVIEVLDDIKSIKPEFIVSCAYGQIIPQEVLDVPSKFPLNVHASLLPKYRGAAPIQRAIMNGDSKTGITIMQMEAGLDTGPMFLKSEILIGVEDNFKDIHDSLSLIGSELIVTVINNIMDNNYQVIIQDDNEATYAPKITKEDELLNFNQDTMPIYNQIRALSPTPGSLYQGDKTFKIYQAKYQIVKHQYKPGTMIIDNGLFIATNDGLIEPLIIQVPGKQKVTAEQFCNGLK